MCYIKYNLLVIQVLQKNLTWPLTVTDSFLLDDSDNSNDFKQDDDNDDDDDELLEIKAS